MCFDLLCPSSGRRLGHRADKEKEARGSVLGADLADCGGAEKDAAHRPEHVLSCRPGAHQHREDQIFSGSLI